MTKLSEKEVISVLAKKLGIADLDDVVAFGGHYVLKCDMLVSSTDVPPQMKPWQIARKSIVSCASDLAAKGAAPALAMMSLGLPNSEPLFVRGLADGFARASREFGVKIMGGDTNKAGELVIDCCMVGTTSAKVPTRSGAKPGDVVVTSGKFGLAAAGLSILLRGSNSPSSFARRATKSVLEPAPRQQFGTALAKYFSASIDSSDGLAVCLYELAGNSRVDIEVGQVPAAAGVSKFALKNSLDPDELIFHGGEEYEIVATIPKSRFNAAKAAAAKASIPLYVIGSVRAGSGSVYSPSGRIVDWGYAHFRR